VRELVARLLSEPSFRQGAQRVRDELLALPAPAELVPDLEKVVAENSERMDFR
jgi:UDP:flavonoid glycosyltransferase YjiC (YdhE family)